MTETWRIREVTNVWAGTDNGTEKERYYSYYQNIDRIGRIVSTDLQWQKEGHSDSQPSCEMELRVCQELQCSMQQLGTIWFTANFVARVQSGTYGGKKNILMWWGQGEQTPRWNGQCIAGLKSLISGTMRTVEDSGQGSGTTMCGWKSTHFRPEIYPTVQV